MPAAIEGLRDRAELAALDDGKRGELLAEVLRLTEPLRDGDVIRSSLTASVLLLSE